MTAWATVLGMAGIACVEAARLVNSGPWTASWIGCLIGGVLLGAAGTVCFYQLLFRNRDLKLEAGTAAVLLAGILFFSMGDRSDPFPTVEDDFMAGAVAYAAIGLASAAAFFGRNVVRHGTLG